MQPKHHSLALLTLAALSSTYAFEFRTPHEVTLDREITIEWIGEPSLGDMEQSVVLMRDEEAVLTLCEGQVTGSGQCSFTISESDHIQGGGYYLGLQGEDGLTIDISKPFRILEGEKVAEEAEEAEEEEEEEKEVKVAEKENKKMDQGKAKKKYGGKKAEQARERNEEKEKEKEVKVAKKDQGKAKKEKAMKVAKKDQGKAKKKHGGKKVERAKDRNKKEEEQAEEVEVVEVEDDARGHHHHISKDAEENIKKKESKKQSRERKRQFEDLRREAEAYFKVKVEAEKIAVSAPPVPVPVPTPPAITAFPSFTHAIERANPRMGPTLPLPAAPLGDAKTMAVPPTAQPTAIPEPVFSILPFPVPIGTEKVGILPVVPTGAVPPVPHPPVSTEAPKDDGAKADSGLRAAAANAKKETKAETAWEAVLNGVTSLGENVSSTAGDYYSKFKSLVVGKNDSVENVKENDNMDASPKVQTRENQDL
ncbi:hypothetical protein BGZ59_009788 [Podila verticillata]|nr:hypothetical protein BGZ59_009788 [Podila verticillata]